MGLKLSPEDAEALRQNIARWYEDPVAFVLEVFGPGYEKEKGKPLDLDAWQVKALRALKSPKRRVAARACKGPGKTAWESWVGWWFLLTRRFVKAACCSITGDNLDDGLWTELALWQGYSPLLLAMFEHKGEVIESRDHPTIWWLSKRTFKQDASKEKQAETLAGLHADAILVLLDEVGSMPHGVFDAAKAIFNVVGADALLCVAGNCTDIDGPLYKICTEDADEWEIIGITGDPDDPERSPRIDIEVARREIAKHGREDPVVMVNILGLFPPKGTNKLLSADEVMRAEKRVVPRSAWEREPLVWGLDVAAEGMDKSVLRGRQGPIAYPPVVWRGLPTDTLAHQVAFRYHEGKKTGAAPKKIFVDKGAVGRGTYDTLVTLLGTDIVIGVDFGSNALDETLYANRRTEMWCLMANWVREVGCLPPTEGTAELRRDLTGPSLGHESSTTKGTRYLLEKKKDVKKRGLPSPDDGDALGLTFAAPVLPDALEDALGRNRAQARTAFDPYAYMAGGG